MSHGHSDVFCLLCLLYQKFTLENDTGVENILSTSVEQKENPYFVPGYSVFIKNQTGSLRSQI
jgi:hypothetical protein